MENVSPPTSADGVFRLEGVAPGEVSLVCTKDGWGQRTTPPLSLAADRGATGVVLKMTPSAHVRGTVSSPDGRALRDALVLVARERPRAPGEREEPWREKYRWRGATVAAVRADGTYDAELPFGPPGRLLVRAASSDHAETDAAPVDLVEGRAGYVVDVVLDAGVDLVGKVVARGGAPVAGAEVSVSPRRGDSDEGVSHEGPPEVWAVTDAGGVFRVPHLPASPYDLLVRARGRLAVRAGVALHERPTPSPTIELPAELSIEGIVVFADGTPAPGLEVSVPDANADGALVGLGYGAWTAVTDARGAFRVGGLREGAHQVVAEPAWGSPVNARTTRVAGVAAGTKDLRIVVEAGAAIRGRVADRRGAAVPGAWITATGPAAEDGGRGGDWHGTNSGADGTFALLGLRDAAYEVTVQPQAASRSYRGRELREVAAGEKALEVVLDDGLRLSGVLVDAQGRGVPEVALSASPADESSLESYDARTQEDGAFEFAGLAPGPHRVAAATRDAGDKSWLVEPSPPVAAGSSGLRLTATKSAMVAGVVVDERGAPLEGADVWARGPAARSSRTRRDGTFEIVGLPHDAVFLVSAHSAGRLSAILVDVASGAAGLRLVLVKGLTSSGRLLDVGGKPMPDEHVNFETADGLHAATAKTDAEGRFTVGGLVDAVYAASFSVGDESGPVPCGDLKAGERNVELRARR
jgi:hypothetical protein